MFGSPVLWGVLQTAIREGRTWYYGDHAYLGRGKYYRITVDAYQYQGALDGTPHRFKALNRPIRPWNKTGRHILICPNSEVHYRLHGLNMSQWIDGVRLAIQRHTDRPIRVRMKRDARPIQDDLVDAFAVVTYSSASALDALIAGIPVFVLAPFAAAHRFGLSDLHQIESPIYPDGRERLLWTLANHQWTLAEMRSGAAWRDLHAHMERRTA